MKKLKRYQKKYKTMATMEIVIFLHEDEFSVADLNSGSESLEKQSIFAYFSARQEIHIFLKISEIRKITKN